MNHVFTTLKAIEEEHQLRVVFACDAGSNAWGYPSPTSDIDLKFFYVPMPWTDVIEGRPDTLLLKHKGDVGPDLDIEGWTLTKALRLITKSNTTVFERLYSPIQYLNTNIHERLRYSFERNWFGKPMTENNLSMARKTYAILSKAQEPTIKDVLTVVRCILLAYSSVAARRPVAPTIDNLLNMRPLPRAVVREIRNMILWRSRGILVTDISQELNEWITYHKEASWEHLSHNQFAKPNSQYDFSVENEILQSAARHHTQNFPISSLLDKQRCS